MTWIFEQLSFLCLCTRNTRVFGRSITLFEKKHTGATMRASFLLETLGVAITVIVVVVVVIVLATVTVSRESETTNADVCARRSIGRKGRLEQQE